jgi:hypothetical protein
VPRHRSARDQGDRDTDSERRLAWLRDILDDRFIAGAVLHPDPRVFRLIDRVLAVPICALLA